MKLDNWIISKSANVIVYILVLPMLLCFLFLIVSGSKHISSILGPVAICVFLQLTFYIIYTHSLAGIVISHSKGTELSIKPIHTAGLFSGAIVTALCLTLVYEVRFVRHALLLLAISEFIRYYLIARVLLKAEKQPLSFWNYANHIWLLANPLIGIWPLHQRVKNFVIKQENDDAYQTEASSELKKNDQ